jgi:hypothetical protein
MEYECERCGKTFNFRSYFDRHQKTHQIDKLHEEFEKQLEEKDKKYETLLTLYNLIKNENEQLRLTKNKYYQSVFRLKKKLDEIEQNNKVINMENIINISASTDINKIYVILEKLNINNNNVIQIQNNIGNFKYLTEVDIAADELNIINNMLYENREDENFSETFDIRRICIYIFEKLYRNQMNSIKQIKKGYHKLLIYINEWIDITFVDFRNNLYFDSFKLIIHYCLDNIHYHDNSKELIKQIKKEWNNYKPSLLSVKLHESLDKFTN